MDGGAAKRSRLLQRAEVHVANGEFYDAVMIYKGQVARGGAEKALGLGLEGVRVLAKHKQWVNAEDLAAAVFEKVGAPSVCQVCEALEGDAAAQQGFLMGVLGSPLAKDPSDAAQECVRYTHGVVAKGFAAAKEFGAAQKHFVAAAAAAPFAAALESWAEAVRPDEVPLLYTRAFLLYLAHGDPDAAAQLMTRSPPHALDDFNAFLYKAVARNAQPLFGKLVAMPAYKAALGRDPSLEKALEAIASLYFGNGRLSGKVRELSTARIPVAVAPAPAAAPAAPSRAVGGLSSGADLD